MPVHYELLFNLFLSYMNIYEAEARMKSCSPPIGKQKGEPIGGSGENFWVTSG